MAVAGQLDACVTKMHSTEEAAADSEERVNSNREAEALSAHQAAWTAASSAPRRRNRPAQSTARQQRRRLRQAYAAYSHLPPELQDNEYITTGYRVEMSYWESIKSLFGLHNETGNIWTHLIGWPHTQQILVSMAFQIVCSSAAYGCCLIAQVRLSAFCLVAFCRLHTVFGADVCHSLCKASPPCFSLPTVCGSGEPALRVCPVQLGQRQISLVKCTSVGAPNDRLRQNQLGPVLRRLESC